MKTLPETTLRHFFRQLSNGLQVLNAEKISHRDLKPQNIFLLTRNSVPVERDTNYQNIVLKIGDFGLSKKMITGRWSSTQCGTLTFMAPEVLDKSRIRDDSTKPHNSKADLWSLGLILYASLRGREEVYDMFPPEASKPYLGSTEIQLLHNMHAQMEQGAASLSPEIGSEDLKNFLCGLLQIDFRERMSFAQFVKHPFLSSTTELDKTSNEDVPDHIDIPTRNNDSDGNKRQSFPPKLRPDFPYRDYQKVAGIYSGAIADESKIPQKWDVFGHTGKYKVTRAFYKWELVFHGMITCEGVGIWRKENSKGPRRAFFEPYQQYMVYLCKNNMVDKEKMIGALNEQHDLGQSDKDDTISKIRR